MKENLKELLEDSQYAISFSLVDEASIAEKIGSSLTKIEDAAMEQGIVPLRYQRNLGAISLEEQRKLMHAKVSVIGCGGLGGFVIEELARLGVGEISGWDYDYFQEHNLNRQLMSETRLIGQSKTEAAAKRLNRINPLVKFNGVYREFNDDEGREMLKEQQVVVDAVDNINTRLELSKTCRELGIPLVHGAVNTWYGQVATQFPGENTIEQLYQGKENSGPSNHKPSVLVFLPAMVASLQVAEVLKILLGRGDLLRKKLMSVDMLSMDIEVIDMPGDN